MLQRGRHQVGEAHGGGDHGELDDQAVHEERRGDERRQPPEEAEHERPRRRVPNGGHHVKERVVEHRTEVARDVRVLTVPHKVAGGHEDPAVVGVPEGHRQSDLQDDAQQEQAAVVDTALA